MRPFASRRCLYNPKTWVKRNAAPKYLQPLGPLGEDKMSAAGYSSVSGYSSSWTEGSFAIRFSTVESRGLTPLAERSPITQGQGRWICRGISRKRASC
jgi:hypothetical protein